MGGFSVNKLNSSNQQGQGAVGSAGPWRPPGWLNPQLTSISYSLPAQSTSVGDTVPSTTTLFFDAVFRVSHTSELRITDHPVQTGASLVDHAYALPEYVVLEVGMSDAMAAYQAGIYTANASKSISAYQLFKQIQKQRIPLTLATHLQTYTNMLIEHLSAEDTVRTQFGLRTIIRLRQLILGTVLASTTSARPDQTNTKRS
jgi:Dit-like phage tail protein